MKIYTKTGDDGTTGLIGGTRVKKHHIRIESYGTIDELNSWLGLIRDQEIDTHLKDTLTIIQQKLFVVGAILATDPKKTFLKNGKKRLNIQKSDRSRHRPFGNGNRRYGSRVTSNDPFHTSRRAYHRVILSYSANGLSQGRAHVYPTT